MSAQGLGIGIVLFMICLFLAISVQNIAPASMGDVTLLQIGFLFMGIISFIIGGMEK
jgi:hypothetical protein